MASTNMIRLIAAAIALIAGAPAFADCRDDWICVNAVNQGGNVELRAENLQDYPVTYTLRVRTRYFEVSGPTTVTRTLAPQESARVMMLSRADERFEGRYRYFFEWTVGDKDAIHDDDHLYELPYASGKSYRVLQGYGSRFSHTGLEAYAVDFDMPEGTPVHAARGGVVARVQESHSIGCWEDGCGRYANFIVILHSDGTTGEYYHLEKGGALVEVGDHVVQGQKIGLSGNTGHTTMPHLHFAVYRATEWGNTQSIPVRFKSADGVVMRPRHGARYQAT
jgi:murein DD-endopeptidase MepM/ murein hydrolase activator NlpD